MNTVFLDIETTGLDPRRAQILEVAMLVHDEMALPLAVYKFSLPIVEHQADAKALEVNRYYERKAELAAIEIDAWTAVGYFKDALTGNIVVGNNVQFDLRFVEEFLRLARATDATPWNYHPVDLKALVAGAYELGPAPWSTKEVAEAVGVPLPADAHSAYADANWNADVYYAVTL